MRTAAPALRIMPGPPACAPAGPGRWPLFALVPLSFAALVFDLAWAHRLFTIPLHSVALALLVFVGQAFCRYGLVTPTRSRNPFVVELEHWASLARDVATARDVWTAIRFVLLPPGWRPDNRGDTTEELRRRSVVAVRTDARAATLSE